MSQQNIEYQTPVLLVTHPGRIQDGLRALLRTIPKVGTIYQAADGASASQIILKNHPALVLLDSKLSQIDIANISSQLKTIAPDTRCILMVDNMHQQTNDPLPHVDTVLLSGFSAWDFLMTVEKLLSTEIV